jgi:hypothetical protein
VASTHNTRCIHCSRPALRDLLNQRGALPEMGFRHPPQQLQLGFGVQGSVRVCQRDPAQQDQRAGVAAQRCDRDDLAQGADDLAIVITARALDQLRTFSP